MVRTEMEDLPDPRDVERARTFWAEEDVDQVFDGVLMDLDHLRKVLKTNTASDKECVQALRLLETLHRPSSASPQDEDLDPSVVQLVIDSDELLPAEFHEHSPSSSSSSSAAPSPLPCFNGVPPGCREEQYELHTCCTACLPSLPSMPQSMPPFWGQNPLTVPLLCGFKRLSVAPLMSPSIRGGAEEAEEDVTYKAPCGQSLHNYDDVMRFLLATASYDVLQVDFFTFNPAVQLDTPLPLGPRRPEQDLSRGAEPTPVDICVGDGGARPADFRDRKDRWPHGCFLSRGPTLFSVCCDCSDGCSDATRCACVAMTTRGQRYSYHRLLAPVPSGLYECGPWCDCDRARCQNRLVQRGIRVRLQVFQTEDRGWGVRCRDDLDRGTFVCIYAGVVLRTIQRPAELPPAKLMRADLPSDDEVEVVTEWSAPPVLERSDLPETPPPMSPPTSPPLHVPVIQRPTDAAAGAAAAISQDRDKVQTVLVGSPELTSRPAGDQHPAQEERVAMATAVQGVNGTMTNSQKSLKRAAKVEDVCFLDASREGNVSRFINHSCQPNLFVQHVFTDSHDLGFPVIAFFTSRVVTAGTELTWDYSADSQTAALPKQEVPCLCGSDGCRGWFTIEENLCDMCEVEGQAVME